MSDVIAELAALGAIEKNKLEVFFPRVRDREDVAVLRDTSTEVIVLSKADHMSDAYYETRIEKAGHTVNSGEVVTPRIEDNARRAADFGGYIYNKRWLDFGCGLGGMLDEMSTHALWAAGLEPNRERALIVERKGHRVVGCLDEIDEASLDVVTMFHVLEHLTDLGSTLAGVRQRLKRGGTLLIEVPHARDALFTLYNSEAFKAFTFWSEHLVLHTRQSLSLVLRSIGFEKVEVIGYQRYSLANHLYWLANQKPGGHDVWRFMSNPNLHAEYEATLARMDHTDTLIAICRVP